MSKFELACKELITLPEAQLEQVVEYIRYLKGLSNEAGSQIVIEDFKNEANEN